MKHTLIKGLRILSILSLLFSGSWLAQHYSVNYARADIAPEIRLNTQLPLELKSLPLHYIDENARDSFINGQAFQYYRAHWAGTLESLQATLRQQKFSIKHAHSDQYFSHNGKGWFITGKLPEPGIISAQGYMLRAERQANGTQVWIWVFRDSGVIKKTPPGVLELPPIANAKELFSSSNRYLGREDRIAAYSAPGSVSTHRAYYLNMLEGSGYKQTILAAANAGNIQLLRFHNKLAEINISISPSTDNPELSIDLIQFRQHK